MLRTGLIYLALLFLLSGCKPGSNPESGRAEYVDEQTCITCHTQQYTDWKNSDHDLSMQVATDKTVLADFGNTRFIHFGDTSRFFKQGDMFFVHTPGRNGISQDFQIRYTFGAFPLQQYLIETKGGRLQAFTVAWDVERKRWFSLTGDKQVAPDDPLHWTGVYQNWNAMCAECHSTNLQRNYDPATDSYSTTRDKIDVGCQACHGPSSLHLEQVQSNRSAQDAHTAIDLIDLQSTPEHQIQSCAPCHSHRSRLSLEDKPENGYYNNFMPSLLHEGLYHPDGQIQGEVFVLGSFLQSRMYKQGVKCSDCHNPHSNNLWATGNTLCISCHNSQPNPRFPNMPRQNYDSPDHHFHKQGSDGAQCINCHMTERKFMIIDSRRDHSFRIPRPGLSMKTATPNACNDCHQNRSAKWASDAVEKWYGKSKTRKSHFAEVFAAARSNPQAAESGLTGIFQDTSNAAIIRATALELLQEAAGKNLEQHISDALKAPNVLLRIGGAGGLESLPPTRRMAIATQLLSDSLAGVRQAAVNSLLGLPATLLESIPSAEFQSGLSAYKQVLLSTSDLPGGSFSLALLYERLSKADSAAFFYQRAINKDRYFLPPYLNLANLYSRMNRNSAAEEVLLAGIEALPDEGQLFYTLGLLRAEEGRLKTAAEPLLRATDLMPDNARAQYNAGLALQHLNQMEEAGKMLRRARQLDNGKADFVFALIVYYMQNKQFSDAEAEARYYQKHFPDDPRIKPLLYKIEASKETIR